MQADIKKMLTAIINGQSAMKQELIKKIKDLDKKLTVRADSLETKVDKGFASVDKRFREVNDQLDKQGKSLAYLEDDTPTSEEFEGLEKRLKKVETKIIAN